MSDLVSLKEYEKKYIYYVESLKKHQKKIDTFYSMDYTVEERKKDSVMVKEAVNVLKEYYKLIKENKELIKKIQSYSTVNPHLS